MTSLVRKLSAYLPRSQFGRHAAILGAGAVLNQIVQVLTIPLIGRLYGPSMFGYWALIQSVAAIIATIGGLRYELAMVVAEDQEEAASIGIVHLVCNLLTACLALLAIAMFRRSIAQAVGSRELAGWLLIAPAIAFLTAMGLLVTNLLIREKQFGHLARMSLAQSALTAGAQIGAAFLTHRQTEGLILGGVIGQFVPLFVLARGPWKHYRVFLRQALSARMLWQAARKHMDFPKYTMPGDVVAAFRDRGLVILLGIFGTARIVGFYSLAVRLVWAPQGLVSSSLTSVLFQRAAEEDDLSNLNLLVSGILSKMVWLATPVFVFLAWWSRDLFALFLGEQWRGAGVYAAILCAPALGLLLQGWMDRLLAVARALRVKFAIEAAYTTVGMTLLGASLYLSHNVPLSMGIFAAVTMLYHIAFLIAYYRVCQFPCVKLLHVGWQIVYVVFVTAVVFGSITLLLGNSLGMWLGLAALAVYYTIIACVRRKTTRPGGIREVSQPSIPFLL